MSTLGLFSILFLFCAIVQFGWAQDPDPLKFSCGQVLVDRQQTLNPNTNNLSPGTWPWHAAIYHVQQGGRPEFKCGGTLISPNFVLTAAHCMFDNICGVVREEDYLIYLGKHKFNTPDDNAVEFKIVRAILHPNYQQSSLSNDIGLLKLDRNVKFSEFIQPACLWNELPNPSVYNRTGFVAGWGYTEQGDAPANILRETQMPVVDSWNCLESNRAVFGQYLRPTNYCAAYITGTRSCSGDTGSGMYIHSKGLFKIRGIFSYGVRSADRSSCNPRDYVLFTDVLRYIDWIKESMRGDKSEGELDLAALPSCKKCGKILIGRHQRLIANTNNAPPGAWPWHAAILHVQGGQADYKCGGTLISSNFVLTAAHCMFNIFGSLLREDDYLIYLGKHKLNTTDKNTREFKVIRAILHQSYLQSSLANDIGLLKLNGNAIFSEYIQPICLWNELPNQSVYNKTGFLAGWGYTEQGDGPAEILRETQMPVVDPWNCLESNRGVFGHFLRSTNYCAGYRNGTSVCAGDSGSGMYIFLYGHWKIRGIVSFGVRSADGGRCNPRDYVLFTDVLKYLDWIKERL